MTAVEGTDEIRVRFELLHPEASAPSTGAAGPSGASGGQPQGGAPAGPSTGTPPVITAAPAGVEVQQQVATPTVQQPAPMAGVEGGVAMPARTAGPSVPRVGQWRPWSLQELQQDKYILPTHQDWLTARYNGNAVRSNLIERGLLEQPYEVVQNFAAYSRTREANAVDEHARKQRDLDRSKVTVDHLHSVTVGGSRGVGGVHTGMYPKRMPDIHKWEVMTIVT